MPTSHKESSRLLFNKTSQVLWWKRWFFNKLCKARDNTITIVYNNSWTEAAQLPGSSSHPSPLPDSSTRPSHSLMPTADCSPRYQTPFSLVFEPSRSCSPSQLRATGRPDAQPSRGCSNTASLPAAATEPHGSGRAAAAPHLHERDDPLQSGRSRLIFRRQPLAVPAPESRRKRRGVRSARTPRHGPARPHLRPRPGPVLPPAPPPAPRRPGSAPPPLTRARRTPRAPVLGARPGRSRSRRH